MSRDNTSCLSMQRAQGGKRGSIRKKGHDWGLDVKVGEAIEPPVCRCKWSSTVLLAPVNPDTGVGGSEEGKVANSADLAHSHHSSGSH
jgi:hypothetical protein